MARVLLTHSSVVLPLYYGSKAQAALGALAEVRTTGAAEELALDALVEIARDCDVIVSYRGTAAPRALLERLPRLVAFVRCAVDVRNIDIDAASAAGILVTHATPGFAAAVAEWIVGAMIDLARGITVSAIAYRAGEVHTPRHGRELRGSTLGIIGFGTISRYLAPIATVLGMRVVVADPYVRLDDPALTGCTLDELLACADFVVCLATATPETENLIDARALARMKPDAFLVNPSRGNLVDEEALRQALDTGRIAGCAMDVGRAHDQMPTPALARHPLVVATPHLGGLTGPAIEHQALETVDQVAQILRGIVPAGACNPAAASRLKRLAGSGAHR